MSVPVQYNFSAITFFHYIETFLELIDMETVSDNRIKVYTTDDHLFHLIPCFPHLPAINTFKGYCLEDYFTPWHLEA